MKKRNLAALLCAGALLLGNGLAALIAIAAGVYTYRKMRRARAGRTAKPADREPEK
jgi:hypothetical protein